MSLETFTPPQKPDVGLSGSGKFRTLKASFGDGYKSRAGDGINTLEKKYNLSWTTITVAESEAIDTFLQARGGVEAFLYTLPNSTTEEKFICEEFGETWQEGNKRGFSAVFEKVYDL